MDARDADDRLTVLMTQSDARNKLMTTAMKPYTCGKRTLDKVAIPTQTREDSHETAGRDRETGGSQHGSGGMSCVGTRT